ncbi:Cytochrome c [Gemmata obscuriglobus]|uniref:Cytochrome c n=1 Tax=Gemmata obscuriglobus TaxID=114 RepID=A0A2Z3H8U5_9BACT|nr:cytochrome c [Gemmata obscuriglobus]AWM40842.1 cytochrome c [Gemmata obscuriglobus]QEG25869.1 Cytochrome c [Gemmata obscuriglobus]VTR99885.1 membrane protein : Putative membrane protein OS=Rhodopirellula europaea SH398 GN=RESH_02282 PE=4 SV=1: Cytochrome_CBB3 [Gemmata obscuriglobus UQM 2246]
MYGVDPNLFMNGVLAAVLATGALVLVATVLAAWLGCRGRVMSYLYMFTALFVTFGAVVGVLGFRGRGSDARPWHLFLDMKYQAKYTSQGQSRYFADGRSSRLPVEGTVPFDGTDYAADAGRHAAPNPDFLKADPRYYTGVANAAAKGPDGAPAKPAWVTTETAVALRFKPHGHWFGVRVVPPTIPPEKSVEPRLRGRWVGARVWPVKQSAAVTVRSTKLNETYWVNNLPPTAVERAGGWEALLKRGQTQFDRHCAVCHGASGRGGGGELAYGIVGAYGLSVPPANVVAPEIQTQPDGQLFGTVTNGKGAMPGYGHKVRDVLDRWAIVAYVRELQFAYGTPAVK